MTLKPFEVPSHLLDPAVTGRVMKRLSNPSGDDQRLASLTAREQEVMALALQGLPNKEMARQLGLLESTVKAHLKVILKKLGATNRTQAALLATQLGLSQPNLH